MTGGGVHRVFDLSGENNVLIQGVLNVTPDSFSDGGRFDRVDAAAEQAARMEAEGADIIDVGGESTRPFSDPVPEEEELRRVIPVIEAIRSRSSIPISIDTYKARVARAALEAGADMVNDVTALRGDPEMAAVVAEAGCHVVLMHMKGTPKDMQKAPTYEDCIAEIGQFLEERVEAAVTAGIPRERIILDPGIGFGKRFEDNLDIINGLSSLKERLGLPLLVGPSRKAFLGAITGIEEPAKRDGATAGAVAAIVLQGADIVRVHNVALCRDAARVALALRRRRLEEAV